MDNSPVHLLKVPSLFYQNLKSSSDPGPLNKCGDSEEMDKSVRHTDEMDGINHNSSDKTESDLDSELADINDLAITHDAPDLLPEQRSRMDSLVSRNHSLTEAKAHAFDKLQEELMKAKETLQLKDEQVLQLSKVRDEMDREITELTASLFEEAHAMVHEANVKRASAERRLKEATGKIEALQAEVAALKMLVITSTPSMPVPQDSNSSKKSSILRRTKSNMRLSVQSHHRAHSLQGPITTAVDGGSPLGGNSPTANGVAPTTPGTPSPSTESKEVDTLLLHDFQSWREAPSLAVDNAFVKRIFVEDVQPCLSFTNEQLSLQLQSSIEKNTLSIEPVNGKSSFPRRCSLSDQQRACHYRIRLGDSENWFCICSAARNRIAAVCDFYTYLRYIEQGIVKSDLQKNYWEIIRLRKQMALAKLGLI